MDLLDGLKGRRSIRSYTEQAIPKEVIIKVIEYGAWAPSAGNNQPWEFVVITKEEGLQKVRAVSPGIIGKPKAVIITCINLQKVKSFTSFEKLALYDIAMACQNIMLASHALGLGSCVVKSFNEVALARLLDLPENVQPELLVTLGYPSRIPNAPPRIAVDELIHWESYRRLYCGGS